MRFIRAAWTILLAGILTGMSWNPNFAAAPGIPISGIPSCNVTQTTAEARTICEIQGEGFTSPYIGETVQVQGVVYGDLDDRRSRLFIQDVECDSNSTTSDGLFIYLGQKIDVANVGDRIEVTGVVGEYYGRTEVVASPSSIQWIAGNQPLPAPVALSPPFGAYQANVYFESLEGMAASMEAAHVVGPTNSYIESWLVDAQAGIERVFTDTPASKGGILCVDDGGLYKIDPQVKVGDQVTSLYGALDYAYGDFRLQLLSPPEVNSATPTPIARIPQDGPGFQFSSATMNLHNLFDTDDAAGIDDSVLSSAEYQRKLRKIALAIHDVLAEPELLAVQEIENMQVLMDLAARPEIEADYEIIWLDGPDQRGLDVALLFRPEHFVLIGYQQRQSCTTLVDGLGPDGNGDPQNPFNEVVCDSNGDTIPDGNRLFSRPPLVVQLQVCAAGCQPSASEAEQLFIIVNHWKSKVEDTNSIEYTLPRRLLQAQYTTEIASEIIQTSPLASLIVLGDLNDFPDSQTLQVLTNSGLVDLIHWVSKPDQFSYNYHGISQVLDTILYHPGGKISPWQVKTFPINSDYPVNLAKDDNTPLRCSDHDPVLVEFKWDEYTSYVPLILKSFPP